MFAVKQDQRWTPIDQNRWSLRAYGREVMLESSGGALSADLNQFDEDASLQVNWRNDDPVNWLIGVYQLAANLFHTPTNSRRNQLVGKHAIKSFGIIAVTAFLGLSACGGTSIELPDGGSVGGVDGRENEDHTFGRILNNVRIGNGASAVTYDSRLDAAAQGHADDMVDRGYFAHNSPEGDDVRDRILEQGYIPIA